MAAVDPLWMPSDERIAAAPLTAFMRAAEGVAGRGFDAYRDLHAWSVEDREAFWSLVWDFCGIVGEKGYRILADGDQMPGAAFFPDARLNFAENLLRRDGSGEALVFRGEDKVERRLTWSELRALVSRLQQLFISLGVQNGDRIAAMMPNMAETVAAMLAAASIGAVFSSCSPDFGEQGVVDRFGQIEPVLLLVPDGYWYNGKAIEIAAKVAAVAARMPSVRKVLVADYLGTARDVATAIPGAEALEAALAPFEARQLSFERLPFAHPLYILFSSGTTGVPKCIVHSAGGTLLQHVKEHRLHAGIVEVLTRGIDYGGTTFSGYRGLRGEVGENYEHLKAYFKAGDTKHCERCGAQIVSLVIAQRTAHFCPDCQQPTSE